MNNDQDIKKELEELAPKLAAMDKDNHVEIPKDYFARMQSSVLEQAHLTHRERVTATQPKKSVFSQLWQNFWTPRLAGALTLVAIAATGLWWMTSNPPTSDAPAPLASLSDQEIYDYVLSHSDDFNLDLIVETSPESVPTDAEMTEYEEAVIDGILDELDEADLDELL